MFSFKFFASSDATRSYVFPVWRRSLSRCWSTNSFGGSIKSLEYNNDKRHSIIDLNSISFRFQASHERIYVQQLRKIFNLLITWKHGTSEAYLSVFS